MTVNSDDLADSSRMLHLEHDFLRIHILRSHRNLYGLEGVFLSGWPAQSIDDMVPPTAHRKVLGHFTQKVSILIGVLATAIDDVANS